jgi:hypothetical protein
VRAEPGQPQPVRCASAQFHPNVELLLSRVGNATGLQGAGYPWLSKADRDKPDWRMMQCRVPRVNSVCSGTGMVVVPVPSCRCITT